MGKKVLVFLLCMVMVVGMIGCASDEVKGDDTQNQGSTGSTDGVTVSLTVWNEPQEDKDKCWYYQAGLATGINVDVTVMPESEYSAKLNQIVASGSEADIMIVWECDIVNFAEVGGILPLDDYIASSDIVDGDDFIDAVASMAAGMGGTYGLPWCVATHVLYYNKDMFDEAGVPYPTNDWTFAEFKSAAEALTKKNADGTTSVYGCTLPNRQTWWSGVGAAGDQIYDPTTGQLVIGDGAVSFVQSVADMAAAGIMPMPAADTADLFSSGMAAMSWQGSWMIGVYGGNLDFNWDIATLPTDVKKYNNLHTGFFTISANSKNPDAAWKVIEYMLSPEGQALNSKASGNASARLSIAEKQEWRLESAVTVTNWDAILDSLEVGVFGYTMIPAGVTNNALDLFESAVLGQITAQEAVKQAMQYAAETIG